MLAKAGFNLKLCARSVDKLETVAHEARQLNASIKTEVVRLDVMSATPFEYAKLFENAAAEPTNIVLNNAGIMKNRMFM